MKFKYLFLIAVGALVQGCGKTAVPDSAEKLASHPDVFPATHGSTIPRNIAPLNFRVNDTAADEVIVHVRSRKDPEGIVAKGNTTAFPVESWHKLLESAYGDSIYTDVYVKRGGKWQRHAPIVHAVADSIDPYISYRLIEPSYVAFENMGLYQRDITNFDERVIVHCKNLTTEENGQCVNCHSYQDYNRTGRMQFHARQGHGGTFIARGDKLIKMNLKNGDMLSAGVYPAWHPTLDLIAYSVNNTTQSFHSRDNNKVEVQDSASDIVLFDPDKNEVYPISVEKSSLETFPSWHPDGKSLFYAVADMEERKEADAAEFLNTHYEDFKYNLLRRTFDPASRTFSAPDTIFKASALGKSAVHPRVSPDGRYLVFTIADYGTFPIWHKEADLYMMDMADGSVRPMDEINSDNVESYHSWSSNGRWMIFSSRRDDGSYTRLYIAHIGKDGKASKPFALPQEDPDYEQRRMKSYNIPEFMARPVTLSRHEILNTLKKDATPARYVSNR